MCKDQAMCNFENENYSGIEMNILQVTSFGSSRLWERIFQRFGKEKFNLHSPEVTSITTAGGLNAKTQLYHCINKTVFLCVFIYVYIYKQSYPFINYRQKVK